MGITVSKVSDAQTSIEIKAVGSASSTNPIINHQYGYRKLSDSSFTPDGSYDVNTTSFTHYETISGLEPGTNYVIRGVVLYDDFVTTDSDEVYVTTEDAGPTRPSNWSWSQTFSSGELTTELNASEWNSFTNHINKVRAYKGLSSDLFSTAYSGHEFTAIKFNQAVNSINDMNPPTSPPSTVSSGDVFYASYLNQLKNSINSID